MLCEVGKHARFVEQGLKMREASEAVMQVDGDATTQIFPA